MAERIAVRVVERRERIENDADVRPARDGRPDVEQQVAALVEDPVELDACAWRGRDHGRRAASYRIRSVFTGFAFSVGLMSRSVTLMYIAYLPSLNDSPFASFLSARRM